jgi:Fe-S-cluster containining protein
MKKIKELKLQLKQLEEKEQKEKEEKVKNQKTKDDFKIVVKKENKEKDVVKDVVKEVVNCDGYKSRKNCMSHQHKPDCCRWRKGDDKYSCVTLKRRRHCKDKELTHVNPITMDKDELTNKMKKLEEIKSRKSPQQQHQKYIGTLKTLKGMARERKIKGFSRMKRPELLKVLGFE